MPTSFDRPVLPPSVVYLRQTVTSSVETLQPMAVYFGLIVQPPLTFGGIFELPFMMVLVGVVSIVPTKKFASFR